MLLRMRCIVTAQVSSVYCAGLWNIPWSHCAGYLSPLLLALPPFLAHSSLSACHLQPQLSASNLRGALHFYLVSECLSITSVLT